MEIPQVNLNSFKAFAAVYETRSMTRAADVLHLTQSGVSQHIKSLEDQLGVSLFTRSGRRLIPTALASEIFTDVEAVFSRVFGRLQKIRGADNEPIGEVRIGMPIEFGNNVIIPLLSEIGRRFKKLTFEITLDYASVVSQHLLDGALDFAFVDESPLDRRIRFEPVATEKLILCCSPEYLPKGNKIKYSRAYFESLEYVEYKGMEPILRRWMQHHLRRKNLRLKVRAHIMDVRGVAKFLSSGLGVGVLPDHLVTKLKDEGTEFFIFDGQRKSLQNEIRLVTLKQHELTNAAKVTLSELKERLSQSRKGGT
jgi:DNA-binding transcriptional LysR family regulator